MKLELKNVKENKQLSHETICFSATVYVDGKKAGTVENPGHGGPHRYHWTDSQLGNEIEAWAKTQPTQFDFEKLDQLIDNLINQHYARKRLTTLCKKKTLFRLTGDEKGAWRTVNAPYTPDVKRFLTQKCGDGIEIIANDDLNAALDK